MKIYIKLDSDSVVRDVITFPYQDYIEAIYPDTVLPADIYSGRWRYENDTFIRTPSMEAEISELQQENAELRTALEEAGVVAQSSLNSAKS